MQILESDEWQGQLMHTRRLCDWGGVQGPREEDLAEDQDSDSDAGANETDTELRVAHGYAWSPHAAAVETYDTLQALLHGNLASTPTLP